MPNTLIILSLTNKQGFKLLSDHVKPSQLQTRSLKQILASRLLIGLFLSVVFLLGFSALAEDVVEKDTLVRFDLALDNELHATTTPEMVQVFRFISFFGSEVVFLITIVLALYYLLKRRWFHLAIWIVATLGGELLNFLLKALFNRPRPYYATPFAVEIYASFPSGHAMLSVIMYGILAYFLILTLRNMRLKIIVAFLAVLVSVLIGISRIYLGVHYLSDIIAGYLAGGIWLTTCITTMEVVRARHSKIELHENN